MTNYIVRRLITSVFILFFLSVSVFLLVRLKGDGVLLSAGGGFIEKDRVEALRKEKGLDKPYFPISVSFRDAPFMFFNRDSQYGTWASKALRGDLGTSQLTGVKVSAAIKDRLPTTVELVVLTMLATISIGVPAGIFSAIYRNSALDLSVRFVAILALSIPSFWLATMVLLIPSEIWGYAPPRLGHTIPPWENPWNNVRQFVPPALVLGTAASATIMRLTRSSLLEVMRTDYIRTAQAKGLAQQWVIYRHALKNVLIPVITVLGLQFTTLLGGTLFVEVIFNIRGVGVFLYEAILRKDFNVVQGMALYIGIVVVLTQLAIDVAYAWIDPRIRYT